MHQRHSGALGGGEGSGGGGLCDRTPRARARVLFVFLCAFMWFLGHHGGIFAYF